MDAASISAGWTLNTAYVINNSCWLVGDATDGLGEHHAFQLLVSTVPEPETYAVMPSGLGLVGAMVRVRKQSEVENMN